MNSLGEAVGSRWDGTKWIAWIWLPSAHYGLNAGRTDLSTVRSKAMAINDDGVVVGQVRFDGEDHAAVWRLQADLDPADLGLLSTGHDETTSIAYGVSNGTNPKIVGQSDYYFSSGTCQVVTQAPFLIVDDSTPTMAALPSAVGSHAGSAAFDVNDDADWKTVGVWIGNASCDPGATDNCNSPKQPILWEPQLPSYDITILPFLAVSPDTLPDEARGVNTALSSDQYEVVGYSVRRLPAVSQSDPCHCTDTGCCLGRAYLWHLDPVTDIDEVNLHENAIPALACTDHSEAEAITNRDSEDRMQVVGWSANTGALRWHRDPNATNLWTKDVLLGLVCESQSPGWFLTKAFDINDDGLIIGYGFKCGTHRAFLLVPAEECPCAGDFDLDVDVDGVDLAVLLAAWGGCGRADLNGDGDVDGLDLAALLANWGTCPGSSFGPTSPPTLEDLIEILEGAGHHDLAELLESVWPTE